MKILAGIVLFNPDLIRLKENIDAVIKQVDKLVLIDNNSKNDEQIKEILSLYPDLTVVYNDENKGIAFALHQIMVYAKKNDYDWVLSLDQDSVCMQGLVSCYKNHVNRANVGIMTCDVVDRNFEKKKVINNDNVEKTDLCITSGSFTSVEAYFATDGYDIEFFIDSVDHDLCLNMKKHGFSVLKVNFYGLLHEIGKGKKITILKKEIIVYNHSSFRHYYIARNKRLLVYKYPQEFNFYTELFGELKKELSIVLFENEKIKKLMSRWKGLRDAKQMKRLFYVKRSG